MVRAARVVYVLPNAPAEGSLRTPVAKGDVTLTLPLPALGARAGALHYRLELIDEHDNIVARAGSATNPLAIQLTSREEAAATARSSWYEKWWVWTLAGAAVAGAAAAVVLIATHEPASVVDVDWTVQSLHRLPSPRR